MENWHCPRLFQFALKRWAPENWILLLKQLSTNDDRLVFHLYGTNQDKIITDEVSSCFDFASVHDHAGKTDLSELAEELASCRLVIGNDTGSMHLANMLGTWLSSLDQRTQTRQNHFESNRTMINSTTDDINEIHIDDVVNCITAKL